MRKGRIKRHAFVHIRITIPDTVTPLTIDRGRAPINIVKPG